MIPDSLFSSPQSPFFVILKVLVSSCSEPLFRPGQSPVSSSHLKVLSVLFRPLRPLSSSQSPPPSSPIPVPILSDSRSHPLHPIPSSQSPLPSSSSHHRKTAERHEAVPPFLVVGCSKMEHDPFTSCSSTVCSRTV